MTVAPASGMDALMAAWRWDPVLFVQQNFGVEPYPWQVPVLQAFGDGNVPKMRIAMQACAGPGKTAVLAWCAWNFLSCYGRPGLHPKGAVVSETSDNLYMNLWPELALWRGRSAWLDGLFEQTSEVIRSKDPKLSETWCLYARSWPRSANPDEQGRTLSGVHSPFVLFLIDESGIVPPAVLRAADQTFTRKDVEFGRIMQAGNPLSRKGMLYAAAVTLREQWRVFVVTGDPDDPNRAEQVDIEEVREAIRIYGRDHAWVKAYYLGQFPDADFNALLAPEEVEASFKRAPRENEFSFAPKVLGADIAFSGDDRTVIIRRQGCIVHPPMVLRVPEPTDVAIRIAQEWTTWGADACFIDNSGGFGTGVVNALRQAGFSPIPIQFAGKPIDPVYANKRAEMWFAMRDWVRAGGALPKEPAGWVRELTEPTYTQSMSSGKTILEDKTLIKKRLNFSPDLADALALTFAAPVSAKESRTDYEWNRLTHRPQVAVEDMDPLGLKGRW